MEFTLLCFNEEMFIWEAAENRLHMGDMVFLTSGKIRILSRQQRQTVVERFSEHVVNQGLEYNGGVGHP